MATANDLITGSPALGTPILYSPVLQGQWVPLAQQDRHVRRSGDDYANQFLTLLPNGQAWPHHPLSTLVMTCFGLNEYYGFVDGRAADLLEIESDPRKTVELLPDWERNFGLPDECVAIPQTIAERQVALVNRMTYLGQQSRQFFLDLESSMGFPNQVIHEHAPFMVGVSQVGDTRNPTKYPGLPVGEYRWEIGPPEIRFQWSINASHATLIWFRCGGGGGHTGVDPHVRIIYPSDLDCIINRFKPAHTELVFDYSGAPLGPMEGTP